MPMNDNYSNTAALLRQKREALNLTQGQIAMKSKCSLTEISKLERGVSSIIKKAKRDRSFAQKILESYKITHKELLNAKLKDDEKMFWMIFDQQQ